MQKFARPLLSCRSLDARDRCVAFVRRSIAVAIVVGAAAAAAIRRSLAAGGGERALLIMWSLWRMRPQSSGRRATRRRSRRRCQARL